MYGGGGNEDPVDTLQGDPDMFGDFDPISQMGSIAAGAGSALANRGETYEEFKQRTGETSMKAYMRDNPTGSK